MSWQNTKNKYKPTGQQTQVGINLKDVKRFNDYFINRSTYEFFVQNKLVWTQYLVLSIRSMRINEFLDMLDDFEIPWKIMEKTISI